MSHLSEITASARRHGLAVVGAFHPRPEDLAPEGTGTLVLLGADGPGMWEVFSASGEHADGAEHPMDRWSQRVITALSVELNAQAVFPFGGPPWHAFQRWAAAGEGAVNSPVRMQATETRGLWASYRGALAFTETLPLPEPARANPCLDCPAPCLTACPVDAFAEGGYDIPRCTSHVRSSAGSACRTGCLVRSVCPAGQAIALPDAQRAFHMAAFLHAHP